MPYKILLKLGTLVLAALAAHAGWANEALRLNQDLKKIENERLYITEEIAELRSIRAIIRRMDVPPEVLAELHEPDDLIESRLTDGIFVVAPAFAGDLRTRIVLERRGEQIHVDIYWSLWDGKQRNVGLILDPREQTATFDGNPRVLRQYDFRIAILIRLQILVHWSEQSGTPVAVLRVFNGYRRHQIELPAIGPFRESRGVTCRPYDRAPASRITIVPLTDGDNLFILPGDNPLTLKNLSEDDRFLLSLFQEWGAALQSGRRPWQNSLLEALAELEELSDPAEMAPDLRKKSVERKKELIRKVRDAVQEMGLAACEAHQRLLDVRLKELQIRHRLLSLQQDEAMTHCGAYHELAAELKTLNEMQERKP